MNTNKLRISKSLTRQRQSPIPPVEPKLYVGSPVSQSPPQKALHQMTFYQRLRLYYKSQNTLTPKPWNSPLDEQRTILRLISVHDVIKPKKKELQTRVSKNVQIQPSTHKRFVTDMPKIQPDALTQKIRLNFKSPIHVLNKTNSFGPWDSPL
ncbi:unnamed protein product (macronuclear) [Paramecium tetraurelia]|uniref:Uncharacterized protein n=1 Tax=Paramecium tetraurelia TaxID=5888 RepID=A0BMB3_PARTE|nr:uncharacterized protein GSPATT00030316001 [Paramecium tetraurelia]CAK59680.1 unnamed protein product [Paramecium tetraurelia]|eukprot:XP_001427078.1 hypothetical protein (macronuclear) [Paramecium tetraurelia strain d4-2]